MANTTGPACGTNPNYRMSDGDRRAVEDFKACLTARAALRDRIAAAVYERNNPGRPWADAHPDDRLAYGFDADAVLAVLPPSADQAASTIDADAALRETEGEHALAEYGRELARLIRQTDPSRIADEDPSAEVDVEHCVHDRAVHTRHHQQPVTGCPWCTAAAEAPSAADPDRVVAYRSKGGLILRCLSHIPPEPEGDFDPVTSEDLLDGGMCTYPECGVDVLIPQPAAAARQDGARP